MIKDEQKKYKAPVLILSIIEVYINKKSIGLQFVIIVYYGVRPV